MGGSFEIERIWAIFDGLSFVNKGLGELFLVGAQESTASSCVH